MPASDRLPAPRSHWKRWLYLVHRWIGIAACLFFAIWFLSGLVMLYVPFPHLDREERIAGMAPVNWNLVRTLPGPTLRAAGVDPSSLRALSLEMRGPSPVWRAEPREGDTLIIGARDGAAIGPADAEEAGRTASAFAKSTVTRIEPITRDQWTVAGGFNRDRPLWKVDLAGPGGRTLYVSSRTGAVVLDTNARERFWNWLGSVPHWIYPTIIRQDNAVWRQVVMWLSGPCIVAAFTGMWIGLLRVRVGKRRFSKRRTTPYHGWMHWHHVAGLFGGGALLLWIFSGWLSVDPFRLFASDGIDPALRTAYMSAEAPAALSRQIEGARRISFFRLGERHLIRIERPDRQMIVDAATGRPATIDPAVLKRMAGQLIPGAHIVETELLRQPDAYWYAYRGPPTLPVLRYRFDDPAGTWLHIDPADGSILSELDRRRRIYRWLFDLFHKWDFPSLTLHPLARELLLWLLSILGLVTSISGIVIGWRRLRRPPHMTWKNEAA